MNLHMIFFGHSSGCRGQSIMEMWGILVEKPPKETNPVMIRALFDL